VAVVHNGIIENYADLRADLQTRHQFASETDSEILVHLYEEMREKHDSEVDAFRAVFAAVHGLNAIVLLDLKEDCLLVAKNGSPLVLGLDDERTYIASDALSFQPFTSRAIFLEDHQGVKISRSGVSLFSLSDGSELVGEEIELEAQPSGVSHTGYDSYMAKEIAEQPEVLRRMAQEDFQRYSAAVQMLRSASSIFVTGCGTAFHAGEIGSHWLSSALGKKVWPILASELESFLPYLNEGAVIVVLSQSGETIDVVEPISQAQKQGVGVLSLVNVPYSTLFRMADEAILLAAGPEKAVASTKAFTAQVSALWVLAQQLGDVSTGAVAHDLRAGADALENLLIAEQKLHRVRTWAKTLRDVSSFFVLGNHELYSVAREIALKVKEISYIHAEGLVASELKHGTLALIEPGVTCLVLSGRIGHDSAIGSSMQEIRARGGDVIEFGEAVHQSEQFWQTGASPLESILSSTLLGQILALELTRVRGLNPDKPRNLAKSVTVK